MHSDQEKRRAGGRTLVVIVSAALALSLAGALGFGGFCYFSESPARLGSFAVHSERGHPGRIDYWGKVTYQWVGFHAAVESLTEPASIDVPHDPRIVRPRFYYLPYLVITQD